MPNSLLVSSRCYLPRPRVQVLPRPVLPRILMIFEDLPHEVDWEELESGLFRSPA